MGGLVQNILQHLVKCPARPCKKILQDLANCRTRSCKVVLQDLARRPTRSCKTSNKILQQVQQDPERLPERSSTTILLLLARLVTKWTNYVQDCKISASLPRRFGWFSFILQQDLARLMYMDSRKGSVYVHGYWAWWERYLVWQLNRVH